MLKIIIIIKMALLILLTSIVMVMLMPAMIFGGTRFLSEVYKVLSNEFRKLRGIHIDNLNA